MTDLSDHHAQMRERNLLIVRSTALQPEHCIVSSPCKVMTYKMLRVDRRRHYLCNCKYRPRDYRHRCEKSEHHRIAITRYH